MSTKTKKKRSSKGKAQSFRLSKSSKLTMEAIEEMFPHFNKTDVIEWAFVSLRQTMLEDEPLLPKPIRLKIIRAEVTSLEQEMKEEKYVLIHAKNRAESWNQIYDNVQNNVSASIPNSLKHLQNSQILSLWKQKNDRILELYKEYQTLLGE